MGLGLEQTGPRIDSFRNSSEQSKPNACDPSSGVEHRVTHQESEASGMELEVLFFFKGFFLVFLPVLPLGAMEGARAEEAPVNRAEG